MEVDDKTPEAGGSTERRRAGPLREMGRRLGTQAGQRNAIGDRVRERRVALGLTVDQVHSACRDLLKIGTPA